MGDGVSRCPVDIDVVKNLRSFHSREVAEHVLDEVSDSEFADTGARAFIRYVLRFSCAFHPGDAATFFGYRGHFALSTTDRVALMGWTCCTVCVSCLAAV